MRYIDRIRWQCRLGAGNPALAVPGDSGESVTYGRLASYLDNARRRLRERGARPRAVYGLLVGDALLHIVLMLALEDIGAATVTLSDPETAETWPLAGILSDRDIVKSAFPVWRAHPNWLHMGGEEPQSGTAA